MRTLQWSQSHAVFISEIDDEHREIFEALAAGDFSRLPHAIAGHFAHEERLMQAARYSSMAWHKLQHDTARKRVKQFLQKIQAGDPKAAEALVEYLTNWLHNHTRLA